MTSFPLRMAWRETRAAWRHFLYFFLCIALGVGGLVGVALFASNVERTVTREAPGWISGDLGIRLSRPMNHGGGVQGQSPWSTRNLSSQGWARLPLRGC